MSESSEPDPTRVFLQARLKTVRSELLEVIDRVSDFPLDWSPSPGMRTIGGQLFEIVSTEVQVLQLASEQTISSWESMRDDFARTDIDSYLDLLAQIREQTLAAIDAWSDHDLEKLIAVPEGWWEGMGLPEVPRSEILRSLAAHEWYHCAQLTTYGWAAGRDPYKD